MAVAADTAELRVEPSLERARALAAEGNVVPVRTRFVDDCETPVSAFLKLRAGEPEGAPCFLLESAEQGQVGRYSFVGIRPRSMLRWSDGTLSESGAEDRAAPDPYGAVAETLARYELAPVEGLPPFAGGAVGFFGYDLVRTVEPLGEPNPDPLGLPDMALMITDVLLVFDHLRHELTIMSCAFADDEGGIDAAYERAVATIGELRERLRGAVPAPEQPDGRRAAALRLQHAARGVRSGGRADRRVRARRRRLPGGPLAALLRARPGRGLLGLPRPARGQPVPLHVLPRVRRLPDRRRLARAAGQGPGAAGRDAADRRHLPARQRRGGGPPARRAAVNDPKERAEHVMLVDLGRNDLGRVCEYGSVKVDELMVVETYSHVLHIVSRVSGTLREGVGAMDVLRSALPAGTLSGAPKVRAMQIIDELEPVKRCSYGGAIGYLSWNGDLDTAIHIRTVVIKDGQVHVQAGGGTVADAKPAYEYNESVNKAKAVFRAVELACEQPDWP